MCVEDVEAEIRIVTDIMHRAARFLPLRTKSSGKNMCIYDNSLKETCRDSKAAWRRWRAAGRPVSDSLYADIKTKKRGVKQYINTCRARHEYTHLQQRDNMLRDNEYGCLHVPKKQNTCHKLQPDGATITDLKSASSLGVPF